MDNAPYIVRPHEVEGRQPRFKLEIRKKFAGKKIRRFFKVESEAYDEGDRLTGQIRQRGVSSLESNGLTVNGAIKLFWLRRGPQIKGKSHRAHLERVLRLFGEKYGRTGIKFIGHNELFDFWNRPEWPDGNSTRWQAFAYLRIFFNWLEKRDLIDKNPIRRVDPPARPKPLTSIVTPEAMAEYLKLPQDFQRAFVCLGGLAGLRTSEVRRVDPAKDLNWKGREIRVVGSNDNGERDDRPGAPGERYVKMEPAFIRNCPRKFTFPNQRNFYASMRKAIDGRKLPTLERNALRHSWFTYHLAKFKNAALTAHEGGNSEDMVKKVYALPAKRANQQAFWRL